MNPYERYFPWAMVGVGLLYLVFFFVPRDDEPNQFHYAAFSRLPVVDHGRYKPMDTVARVSLVAITGNRQTFTDDDGYTHRATDWLIETLGGTFAYQKARQEGMEKKTLVIDDAELRDRLELPAVSDNKYSLRDLGAGFFEVLKAGRKLAEIPEESRNSFQKQLYAFYEQVQDRLSDITQEALLRAPGVKHKIFRVDNDEVLSLLGLEARPRFRYSLAEFGGRIKALGEQARRAQATPKADRTLYDVKVLEVNERVEIFHGLTSGERLLSIAPLRAKEDWRSITQVGMDDRSDPFARNYVEMLLAYNEWNIDDFNKALKSYREALERHHPQSADAINLECFVNNANPFFHLQHIYMLVFLFGCLSWLAWSEPFRKAGLYLAVLALVVHTLALFARMYIMQRPFVFVTNLYSSAIFIGWGAVMTGVVLDFIFKNGIGVAAAGAVGYCTLIIAYFGLGDGDTLGSLEAVLDTNFWLATHVTTVTFGYTATFFAGAIGLAYILLGMFTPLMAGERSQITNKMLYGVICFAMLLSFVGTVLGGIWADQSWGRFWGWDPKENGALLIVIWNALILHARWGGMIKTRGMAVLAVLGTCVTAWSWFGTNMLGVGLHSYGFMQGAVFWLLFFVGTMAGIALVGSLIPLTMWRSFTRSTVVSTKWTRLIGAGGIAVGAFWGLLAILILGERSVINVMVAFIISTVVWTLIGGFIGMVVDSLVEPRRTATPAVR